MQYTEQELSKLIQDVESEFTAHLAKAEAGAAQPSLAKAEDEKPAEESKESKADNKEEKPEAKESKEESKEAPAKDDAAAEAKPEGEAAPSEAQPTGEAPVAPSADEGASGYDAEDIAHMDAMYMSMSKAELLAHHDSCVRALDAQGAEHVHAAPAAQQAAPAAPAQEAQAPAADIDKCGDMSMSKSEKTTSVEVKTEVIAQTPELEIAKSEAAAHKAKAEELQKSLDTVSAFLTQLVKKVPQGKAITQYEQVAKSEVAGSEEKQLSKSEITSILAKKAGDPTLSKNDRDAINAYYLNNSNVNTISHLLK